MAVTIDITKAVYDVIANAITADTGVGGLGETSGTNAAFIRRVIRDGDPVELNNLNWPQLRIAVLAGANQPEFGFTQRPEVTIRLTLVTRRDRAFSSTGTNESGVDNILLRIRNLFSGMSMAAIAGGWSSTVLHLVRGPVAIAGTAVEMRHLYEFNLTAKAA